MTLPSHAHDEPHLQGFGPLLDDPDQVHDWVDGREFSTTGTGDPENRLPAAFNDVNPTRYERWAFDATVGGVGRSDNAASFIAEDLRSPAQMLDSGFNPFLLAAEIIVSISANIVEKNRSL